MARLRLLLAAFVLVGARSAAAQASPGTVDGVFWPELDLYYRVSTHVRLYGIATYTIGPSPVVDNAQYGANVDLFAKHTLLFKHRPAEDALAFDRSQPVMLRVGYRYSTDLGTSDPTTQDRLLFELTGRLTRGAFTIAERNGFDLRWTDGDYSTRYRNRVWLEAVVTLGKYQPVPYADAEWFYSIQDDEWTKVRYEAGVHLPVVDRLAVEPYASWEDYWDGSPDQRGLGLNLVLSW
jgi:hypothetical protein